MQQSEKWKWSCSVVSDSSDPMDCSLPGSSIHGIFQARVLEWGAIAFSGYIPGYIHILVKYILLYACMYFCAIDPYFYFLNITLFSSSTLWFCYYIFICKYMFLSIWIIYPYTWIGTCTHVVHGFNICCPICFHGKDSLLIIWGFDTFLRYKLKFYLLEDNIWKQVS